MLNCQYLKVKSIALLKSFKEKKIKTKKRKGCMYSDIYLFFILPYPSYSKRIQYYRTIQRHPDTLICTHSTPKHLSFFFFLFDSYSGLYIRRDKWSMRYILDLQKSPEDPSGTTQKRILSMAFFYYWLKSFYPLLHLIHLSNTIYVCVSMCMYFNSFPVNFFPTCNQIVSFSRLYLFLYIYMYVYMFFLCIFFFSFFLSCNKQPNTFSTYFMSSSFPSLKNSFSTNPPFIANKFTNKII